MDYQEKIEFWHREGGSIICIYGDTLMGKSTIAARLVDDNTVVLDGDVVREFINGDLGYSDADRKLNNERIAKIALMLAYMGKRVIIATVRADIAYDYIKEHDKNNVWKQLIKVHRD